MPHVLDRRRSINGFVARSKTQLTKRCRSQGEDNVHFPYQPEAKTSQYNQISFTCCNEKNDLASFAPPYQHNFGVAILDLPNELLFKVAERLAFRLQNEILALRTVCRRFNEFVLGAIAHSAHTNLATPFTRIAVPFLRLDCEMFLYCSNRSPLSNIVQIVELKLDPNDLFHKFKNKDDDYARNREHYKTLFRLMKKSFGRALEAMTSIDTVILSLRGVNDSDCVLKDQLRVANYVSRLFDSIFGHGRSVNTLGIDGVGANYVGKDLIPYRFIKGTRMHEVLTTVALQLYTRQSPMAHNDLSYWKQFLRCLTRLEKLSLYNCRPKGTDLLLRTRKWKESLDVSSLLEDFTPTLKYIKISKLWFRYDCLDSFLKAISPSLNVLHFDCVGLAPDEETGWLELLKLMRQHLSLAQCNITNSRAGLSYATRQGGWEIVQAYGLWPKDYNMIDMSRYVLREAPCRSRHIEAIEAE